MTPLMCFSGAFGGEMRLHLSDSNAVFSPCHESYTYPVTFRRVALFHRGFASAAPLRLRAATAEHDASAALPDDQRGPDRFLLFGRTLYRPDDWWSGPPPDARPGLHLLPPFFAGWQTARIHLTI